MNRNLKVSPQMRNDGVGLSVEAKRFIVFIVEDSFSIILY